MRNKKAKAIRREVYGDMAPRGRKYRRYYKSGAIIADPLRRQYQAAKKAAQGKG